MLSGVLKNKHVGNIAILTGGTAIGQLINILVSPFLTRLYTPQEFGVFSVYISFAGVLAVVASLKLELALPVLSKEEDAADTRCLAQWIIIVTVFLVLFAALIGSDVASKNLNLEGYESSLLLLPFGVLGVALFQVGRNWFVRKEDFKRIAQARFAQALGQSGTQIAASLLSFSGVGLILGHIIGQFLAVGILYRTLLPRRFRVPLARLQQAWISSKNFAVFTAPASLINLLGTQAPPVLLTYFFSTVEAGYFALTIRVLSLPTAVIGQSVGQVFFSSAAKIHNESGDMAKLLVQYTTVLFRISAPVFMVLLIWAPSLFTIVFGTDWKTAGEFSRLLAPWLLLSFVSAPVSTLSLVYHKQKIAMWISVYETLLRVGVLVAAGLLGNVSLAIVLYAFAGVIVSVFYLAWIYRLVSAMVVGADAVSIALCLDWHGFLASGTSRFGCAMAICICGANCACRIALTSPVFGQRYIDMKHVLFVTTMYPYEFQKGSGSFVRSQALALQKKGINVGILHLVIRSMRTMPQGKILQYRFQPECSNDSGLHVVRAHGWAMPFSRHLHRAAIMHMALPALNLYVEHNGQPDLLHVHGALWAGSAALKIHKNTDIPFVLTEHSSGYRRNLYSDWQIEEARAVYAAAKKVVAVSQSLKDDLQELGVEESLVIPNGVDTSQFKIGPKALARKKFIVLAVAYLTPNKRFDLLIRAFALAFKGQADVELRIVGSGSELDTLIGLCESKGLSNQVEFVGQLTAQEVALEMQQADVFAITSKVETFGVVAIEAMSSGLPVLSTRCGGPEEIIDEQSGLLAGGETDEAYAESLLVIRQKIENGCYKPIKIHDNVVQRFDLKNIAAKIVEVLY